MKDIHFYSGRTGNELFRDAFLYAQMRDGKIPDVYVQDHKYFEKYEAELKERYGEGIGFLPYVSLHVRVGKNPSNQDEPAYNDNPFYCDLTKTDYYDRAVALFPGKKFLVFSDDTEYAKALFSGSSFQVVENQTLTEDFNMAASCESHVIANSSLSWWWAFVSPSPAKLVVAPSRRNWYSDGQERTKCPREWLRI